MNYLSTFLTNFHFIRPWWFLALIALFFALWLLKKYRFNQSPWNKFIPDHLSHILVEGSEANNQTSKTGIFSSQANVLKPFFIGLITITALAGPTWQKLPQPVYQTERGSVLIMDMSYSMYATDIKPNRLTRARFKAVDLLNSINEGDIGLIAYAGDAFVISPLTQDIKNIELLLPSLSPEIMPELGANVFAALSLAHEMLTNAGHLRGDIYWFTDDVDNSEITDIYDWSAEYGHRLNILGVGSQDGAPITLPSGELLKDVQGAIVVPKLPMHKLSGLASRGNGHYQTITHNDNDITALTSNEKMLSQTKEQQESLQQGDQWQEQGPWLLVVILPLLLSYFRRGSAVLAISSLTLPLATLLSLSLATPNVFAAEQNQSVVNQAVPTEQSQEHVEQLEQSNHQVSGLQQTWNDLWKTQDQQAQERYNQQDYQGAAQQFKDSQWQGSAHYKSGNYQQALDAFKQGEKANSANSLYNQGNALAQLQQFEQAIEAYEQALEKDPDLQDAKDNLEKIKEMQKQQEKQEQNQESQENQSDDKNESQENDKRQNSQDQQSQDQQSQDQNNQQSDNSEQKNDADKQPQENQQQQGDEKQEQNQKENAQKENNQESEQDMKEKEAKEQEAQKAEQQGEQDKNKTPAQIAAEQQAKETEQKHKQLLNKVTDDPYLLLRNKMQLEYQKRKQQGASQGAKKKW